MVIKSLNFPGLAALSIPLASWGQLSQCPSEAVSVIVDDINKGMTAGTISANHLVEAIRCLQDWVIPPFFKECDEWPVQLGEKSVHPYESTSTPEDGNVGGIRMGMAKIQEVTTPPPRNQSRIEAASEIPIFLEEKVSLSLDFSKINEIYPLTPKDLERLEPGKLLDDILIDSYLKRFSVPLTLD